MFFYRQANKWNDFQFHPRMQGAQDSVADTRGDIPVPEYLISGGFLDKPGLTPVLIMSEVAFSLFTLRLRERGRSV